ncbi:ankyrin repeat domain-containing protein, partial [Salmonella enterica]|nr:ankyrin repeat domain-containing protein [Salmonella enterica]ECV2210275.1 ankyrin repeat domain-containing protein [Salmonella enterica subsp. enterica serovar Muenchen]ECO5090050.1 ankyrin repeat domain-containing protein [Salmonella enterica]EIA1366123.1 ankyrin repeat domain-containing protein [Salmonella enterica]EIM1152656.1 ankyrin repeat domain-containing protein [Salmonella enterica subsp. enterica serovar Muenchen]
APYIIVNQTYLFEAKNIEEVNLLIESGVDINHRNFVGDTALWKSGYYDYEIEIIDRLFEAGINPDLLNYDGDHVLSGMGYFGHPEIFMKHKDKIKTKEIHIRNIHLPHIHKMKRGIEILLENSFDVHYPRHINIEDITAWDEEQAWYRTEQENINQKRYYMKKRNDYIEFLEYLDKQKRVVKLVSVRANSNDIALFAIKEMIERLRLMKPELYIVK